jgi:hypothetical protein
VVGEAPTGATVPADFRLTVTGRDARNTGLLAGRARWQVVLKGERWKEDSFRFEMGLESGGTLDLGSCPFAANLVVEMCMPSGVAARNVRDLRTSLFPGDSMLQVEALARFRDTSLSVTERNRALLALVSRSQRGGAPLDEDVIRGVLNVIASSPSATQRASLWRQLRGQKHPALVQPLIDASRDEKDDMARLEAVTTLATDFSDAQTAHAALDWVAGTDPKCWCARLRNVRCLAMRRGATTSWPA